jgi:putative tryptophan/tyrosine transport system substrate-binding protein
LTGGLLAASLAGVGQEPQMPTIGVLVVGAPGSENFRRLFQEAMRELGYVDGKTIRFEFRSDRGQVDRLPSLAEEMVHLKVDLIVAWFTPAALAAKKATAKIPIVMAAAGDPLANGLVTDLARPGGNITGMSGVAGELAGKCVERVREMLPSAHRVAALANAPDPFSKPFLEKIRLAGNATGTTIDPIMIHRSQELEAAFVAMETTRPDAVIVQPSLPVKRVAELALKYRTPAVPAFRPFAEDGGLMSYWFGEAEVYPRAAAFTDKILHGAKPGDLPVEQPTKFELVINLKSAKTLGLTIPPSLLARADTVIE